MLLSYSIENFNSIKNECKISFAPSAIKDKNKKLFMNDQILPIVVIYGGNGSGKSSILLSMKYITDLIKAKNADYFLQSLNNIKVFKNKSIENEETKFCFEFLLENNFLYKYEINLSNGFIALEKLSKKEFNSKQEFKILFEISNNKFIKANENLSKINISAKQLSGLSYLNAITEIEDIKLIYDEIKKIKCYPIGTLEPIFIDPFLPNGMGWSFDIHLLEKQKEKFLKIFKEIDFNIIDIKIVKNQFNGYEILFTKNSIYGNIEIPFLAESTGTKKIIQFLCNFISCSEKGCLFCIDELDVSLHPKLLAYVIKLFNSENNKNIQLLYTSHDLYTLDSEFFRRDEIYFTGLNESYFTEIISLNEYKDLNKNSSFSNKYVNGEVGFEPYITKVENWDE
ncbi:MAG: ATP-binding protein [Ureaplasma sp.]|nr:ATP-binding protein [Ureaplasma sp.]